MAATTFELGSSLEVSAAGCYCWKGNYSFKYLPGKMSKANLYHENDVCSLKVSRPSCTPRLMPSNFPAAFH